MRFSIYLILVLGFQFLNAKDLGSFGHTYPIIEEDLIRVMQGKLDTLSEEEKEKIFNDLKDHLVNTFERPKAVEGLHAAKKYKVFYFDPTICTKKEIKDHKGNVVVKKGTKINPLDRVSLTGDLFFFDGTDPKQVDWAKKQEGNGKWILTDGKPLDLEKQEEKPIYFDQFGSLVTKLGIKNIPAKVSQSGKKLKIEEIPIQNLTREWKRGDSLTLSR